MSDVRLLFALLVGLGLTLAACAGPEDAADAPATEGNVVAEPSPPAAEGEELPDLEVDTFDGDTVTLRDFAGTPLVVNFWASWCPPCIAEMPDLEDVHQLAQDRVTFVGVNTQDTPDRAAQLVDETGVTYALVRDPDGDLFQAFGVFGMPSTFYVDAEGTVVGRHTGLLTRDALIDDLREHLGVDLGSGS